MFLLGGVQAYSASYQMHTVTSGDTYYKLERLYGVDSDKLKAINNQLSDYLGLGDLIAIRQIKDIKVVVNNVNIEFDVNPYIENNSVFVPVRFISEALSASSIDWEQSNKSAIVKFKDKTVVVTVGSKIARVNGKTVELSAPVQLYNDRVFVPLRFFSEVVGVDSITWDQSSYAVSIVKKGLTVDIGGSALNYSSEDLYWLSRLVQAEAEGEPFLGKVAVANTVINRKNSPDFPDTIKEVIFDTNFGTQYTPVKNGSIYNTPSQESINAAQKALEGYNVVGDSMYFINPDTAESSWVQNNKAYYTTIENHQFYL